MIKALLRFSLLLMLCSLFVYAPEILSSVSTPYSLAAPERTLLRIALCCDGETSSLLNKVINTYQKEYPFVHLRITQVSEQQLRGTAAPFPNVILCPQALSSQLPSGFIADVQFSFADQALLCAVPPDSPADGAAAQFAAYIDEALGQQSDRSEI